VKRIRRHMTFGNVVAVMALFIALGGTGYAALKLPKNSVGSKQIKKNAVSSSKVKNGSLKAGDFASGQIPAGAVGPTGAKGDQGLKGDKGDKGDKGSTGDTGAAGIAAAYARIDAAGTLIGGPTENKGVTQDMIQHDAAAAAETTGAGVYCIGGLGFDPTSAMVSTDNTDSLPGAPNLTGGSLNFISTVAVFKGEDLGHCDAAHGQIRVAIEQVDQTNPPTLANHGFIIWLEK
jgi:hypothetical protein